MYEIDTKPWMNLAVFIDVLLNGGDCEQRFRFIKSNRSRLILRYKCKDVRILLRIDLRKCLPCIGSVLYLCADGAQHSKEIRSIDIKEYAMNSMKWEPLIMEIHELYQRIACWMLRENSLGVGLISVCILYLFPNSFCRSKRMISIANRKEQNIIRTIVMTIPRTECTRIREVFESLCNSVKLPVFSHKPTTDMA